MEKFARALMTEGCSINSDRQEGFSIAADGTWYLYSDGVVRKSDDRGIGGVYAFWTTPQEASDFYWNWKDKQNTNFKAKECGCGELRKRIAELEKALTRICERTRNLVGGSLCLTTAMQMHGSGKYSDLVGNADKSIETLVGHVIEAELALTQGEDNA